MTVQLTPRGIEVILEATQDGIPVVNVFHVDNEAAVTLTDLDDVRDVFLDWATTSLLPAVSNSYVLNRIVARDISVDPSRESAVDLTTGNAGGNSGVPMPANAALVIGWRTAHIGRSYRGRTYVGGLPQAYLANSHQVTTGVATSFAGIATDLIDGLNAIGKTLSVLSKVLDGVQRVVGILTAIIGVIVDTKIDSQRRRTAN